MLYRLLAMCMEVHVQLYVQIYKDCMQLADCLGAAT